MTPRQRNKANGRKSARRLLAMSERRRRLGPITRKEPLIPESVLKRLAALHLPPNPWVYDVCLRELMREQV